MQSHRLAVLLEFPVYERSEPEVKLGPDGKPALVRRGKIIRDVPEVKWISTWIPWDESMDTTVFVRNLKKELSSHGLACRGEVEKDLRSRILEAKLLSPEYREYVAATAAATAATSTLAAATPRISRRPSLKRKLHDNDDDDSVDDKSFSLRLHPLTTTTSTSHHHTRRRTLNASTTTTTTTTTTTIPTPPVDMILFPSLLQSSHKKESTPRVARPPGASSSKKASNSSTKLGKGKKLCRGCNTVIPSSKRNCPHCGVLCLKVEDPIAPSTYLDDDEEDNKDEEEEEAEFFLV